MAFKPEFNGKTIVKLLVWSLIVGMALKYFGKSAGDVYGYIVEKLSGLWNWLMGTGFEYILIGAAIVVPLYLFSEWRKSRP